MNTQACLSGALDADTEFLQNRQGSQTVLARQEAEHVGCAVGQRTQQERPMRNRLITGHLKRARDLLSRVRNEIHGTSADRPQTWGTADRI